MDIALVIRSFRPLMLLRWIEISLYESLSVVKVVNLISALWFNHISFLQASHYSVKYSGNIDCMCD